METYEERIGRLEARNQRRFEKYDRLFNELYKRSTDMASLIPFGQPILIGHHSENRDRRYREKMNRIMGKAWEAKERASKANKEPSTAITSDCLDAVEQLKIKLASLEKHQEDMKAINKLIKKNDREGVKKFGLSEEQIDKLFNPILPYSKGYQCFELSNNNANIKRVKDRIKQLENRPIETREYEINNVKIVEDANDMRLRLFFDGKPERTVIDKLKRNGFKWSPTNKCWQRLLNNAARSVMKHYVLSENV